MVVLDDVNTIWAYDEPEIEPVADEPVYAIQDHPDKPTILLTIYRIEGDPPTSCGQVWLRSHGEWIPSSMGEVLIDQEPRPSMLFGLVTRFQKHIQETRPRVVDHDEFWEAIARLQDEALRLNFI